MYKWYYVKHLCGAYHYYASETAKTHKRKDAMTLAANINVTGPPQPSLRPELAFVGIGRCCRPRKGSRNKMLQAQLVMKFRWLERLG
mmetsp:Transcript_45526/g.99159  ORF Transcript_45526/g.99159 Transcript_45526/m.99159 type:complete len:87 (-) Transcript_45526:234-494(-)